MADVSNQTLAMSNKDNKTFSYIVQKFAHDLDCDLRNSKIAVNKDDIAILNKDGTLLIKKLGVHGSSTEQASQYGFTVSNVKRLSYVIVCSSHFL